MSDAVAGLVATCRAGEAEFRRAAKQATDPILERLLATYGDEMAELAQELKGAGGVGDGPTLSGLARAERAPTDQGLLGGCLQRLEDGVRRYTEVLDERLDRGLQEVLERQRTRIREACDHIHSLQGPALAAGAPAV